jgi:hypothetical protein
MAETTPKSNVVYLVGREFVLRDSFTLRINPEGLVAPVTYAHLFENQVTDLRSLDALCKHVHVDAQLVANRGRYRDIPMEDLEIRVVQSFIQEDPLASVDWQFEYGLFMVGGEEVEIDETTDYSEFGGEAT